MTEKLAMYLCDEQIFSAIAENDRIQFKGNWYRIEGKQDLMALGRVFRLDISNVITP